MWNKKWNIVTLLYVGRLPHRADYFFLHNTDRNMSRVPTWLMPIIHGYLRLPGTFLWYIRLAYNTSCVVITYMYRSGCWNGWINYSIRFCSNELGSVMRPANRHLKNPNSRVIEVKLGKWLHWRHSIYGTVGDLKHKVPNLTHRAIENWEMSAIKQDLSWKHIFALGSVPQ